MTQPHGAPLSMYGRRQAHPPLEWAWARERLEDATVYWFGTARPGRAPTVRPCWGAWISDRLLLTVGSKLHAANLEVEPNVTVHLSSAREVVIVEGTVTTERRPEVLRGLCAAYNPKYGWDFEADTMLDTGPVLAVEPEVVMAWKSAGAAGRAGFAASGKWLFGRE